MTLPTDIEIRQVAVETEPLTFRAPLKFGGRVITETDLLNVRVRARTRGGREAEGLGSMPLGNVWAWPSPALDGAMTARAIELLGRRLAQRAGELRGLAHPLDHVRTLHGEYRSAADAVTRELGIAEPMPQLAVLVAASPVDAAIHDAFGKANGINSFNGLGQDFCRFDLAHYLDASFRGEYLDRYTLRRPKDRMPIYHLVGALDPLTPEDVQTPISDGLPETLGQWIAHDGLTHLKIKLNGEDLRWDAERVAAVERVAVQAQTARGCRQWCYSLDFNEKCRDVGYVLDFLAQVRQRAPAALERVQYIEQPTHRDLAAHPIPMHEAARIKPVVIDESLVDYESLLRARELGYSGVALKACKGQTEALLMAAAAQKYHMFLCVQDLTCPGASFLHSAELSARIPGVAAIEGNARQYCPAGNRGWAERFPSMFQISDGMLGTGVLDGPGLGH